VAFNGTDFVFDNKSLSMHGFILFTQKENDEGRISNTKYTTDKAQNTPFFNIIAKDEEEPLEFDLYFGRDKEIERYEFNSIKSWLQPNDNNFHKLYILQDDLHGYYYNCVITKINYTTFNNVPYCLKCHVVCDSQYLYSNERIREYMITESPTVVNFNNVSSSNFLYPIYEIECNRAEGTVEIENTTIDKSIKFVGLKLNEVITIDTLEKTIKSSHDLNTFNRITSGCLNFIKLKQGKHTFNISGDTNYFKIKFKELLKYGC